MKKVKFNATTCVHMMPDDAYAEEVKYMQSIKYKSKEKGERLLAGSGFAHEHVVIDEVKEVPEWYYEAHKNRDVDIGVSFDKYTDAYGNRIPFDTKEALRHNDISSPTTTMKKVKLFELVK